LLTLIPHIETFTARTIAKNRHSCCSGDISVHFAGFYNFPKIDVVVNMLTSVNDSLQFRHCQVVKHAIIRISGY